MHVDAHDMRAVSVRQAAHMHASSGRSLVRPQEGDSFQLSYQQESVSRPSTSAHIPPLIRLT